MPRRHCKCTVCDSIMWFADDSVNQAAICICTATRLTEGGPEGSWTALSSDEKEVLTNGVLREDLTEMRAIFDDKSIPRARHCFRWNITEGRWELSRVMPADRTLVAYRDRGEWVEV